jgi:hypothetical protein
MGDLVIGNLLTLVTEFIAVQAGGLYFGIPSWLSVAFAKFGIIRDVYGWGGRIRTSV